MQGLHNGFLVVLWEWDHLKSTLVSYWEYFELVNMIIMGPFTTMTLGQIGNFDMMRYLH